MNVFERVVHYADQLLSGRLDEKCESPATGLRRAPPLEPQLLHVTPHRLLAHSEPHGEVLGLERHRPNAIWACWHLHQSN